VTPELAAFVSGLDMFYFGTASAAGQPYIQYRGGSPGFLKVLDDQTLGFADFGGTVSTSRSATCRKIHKRSSS
jgi:uncharacterized protein